MKTFFSLGVAFLSMLSQAYDLGKFHCVGDSLTFGAGGLPGSGGYRHQLATDLRSNGFTLEPVGSLNTWPGGSWSEGFHDGHGGWSTTDLTYGRDGLGNVADWVARFQPKTVLLMSGRNDDWSWFYSGAGWYQPYSDLVGSIFSTWPDVTVFWANCFMPRDWDYWEDQRCQAQDAALRQVVFEQRLLGRKIFYVDMYRNLHVTPSDYSDTVHLNQSGYDKEEKIWLSVLKKSTSSLGGGLRTESQEIFR